jgi:hypothetical protein
MGAEAGVGLATLAAAGIAAYFIFKPTDNGGRTDNRGSAHTGVIGVSFSIDLTRHFTLSQIEEIRYELDSSDWEFGYNISGWTPISDMKKQTIWNITNGILYISTRRQSEQWSRNAPAMEVVRTGLRTDYIPSRTVQAGIIRISTSSSNTFNFSAPKTLRTSKRNGIVNHAFAPVKSNWWKDDTTIVHQTD